MSRTLGVLMTAFGIGWTIPAALAVPRGPFQLFVDRTVSTPSAPWFNTIAGALRHIGSDSDGVTDYHILVYPGVYTETVVMETPHVTLEGVSRDLVRLVSAGAGRLQIQLVAGSLTVRNLTFVRGAGDSRLRHNMQVLLDQDRDDVLIENCRFVDSPAGVIFFATKVSSEFNENIQFRNNVVESTVAGVHVDVTDMGDNKGYIDFLTRNNQVVIRHTGSGPVGYFIRRLADTSRFRSLSDSLDVQSEDGSGTGDVNGYVFMDWMPEISEIVGAQILLTYIDRTDALQSFAGVKIHGPENNRRPASGERVIVLSSDTAIHIVDHTKGVSGSGGHAYQNAAARVDVFVSGGTVTWEVDDPAHFGRDTLSLVGEARESQFDDGSPNGIFYAGLPVDNIIVGLESGVDGVVAPCDQGAIKATQGLVGSSTTISIDDLAATAHVDQAETISGAWTRTGALPLSANSSSTTGLWFMNDGTGNINDRDRRLSP